MKRRAGWIVSLSAGGHGMHAIFTTIGTAGDVLPYVALGAALRARGHRVTVACPEPFAPLARRESLDFEPLVPRDEHEALIANPDFWHPLKGPRIGARWGVRLLRQQYDLLASLARDEDSVLVTNPAILAARLVHETLGRPVASVLLQPWMVRSNSRPPVFAGSLSLPRWAPSPVKELYWGGVNAMGYWLMGRELNDLRVDLRLPRVGRVFEWWMSPQLMLGLFPTWFGDPQPDWPGQLRLTGFALYDGARDEPLAPDVERFLQSGEPPVAITFGTGMRHARTIYRNCIEACVRLGRRTVIVTRYAEQLPAPLPASAIHAPFASFRGLFARCAAVVHHGGVGTLAEACHAGTPQLLLPTAWDQFDNAIRIRELGAGDWLPPRRHTTAGIAKSLERILAQPRRRERATPAEPAEAVVCAVRHIEALAATNPANASRGLKVRVG